MGNVWVTDGTSLAGLIIAVAALITAMAAYRRAVKDD